MAKTALVSVRLDPDLNERIAAVAAALDRPKSWAITQAVKEYLADQEWQLAAIEEGLRDADAGRVVDQSSVLDWVRSWDSEGPTPIPQRD
jgi:predicted transcriptional regulator